MKHVHKYRRQKIGRRKDYVIYRCARPGCSHYVSEDFIEGRQTMCWTCDAEFTLVHRLVRARPICETCKQHKKQGVKAQPIENFDLDKMLREIDDEEDFL